MSKPAFSVAVMSARGLRVEAAGGVDEEADEKSEYHQVFSLLGHTVPLGLVGVDAPVAERDLNSSTEMELVYGGHWSFSTSNAPNDARVAASVVSWQPFKHFEAFVLRTLDQILDNVADESTDAKLAVLVAHRIACKPLFRADAIHVRDQLFVVELFGQFCGRAVGESSVDGVHDAGQPGVRVDLHDGRIGRHPFANLLVDVFKLR